MKKLFLMTSLQLFAFVSCATATPSQPIKSTAPKSAESANVTSNCVRSTNEFGHPVKCDCGPGMVYSALSGTCVRGGRMCTQALVELFNEKSSRCYTARNGCDASDLKVSGWRARQSTDICK